MAGLKLEQATRVIADAGLQVGVVSKASTNEQPPGTVLGRNPATQAAADYGANFRQLPDLDAVLPALGKETPVLAAALVTDAWIADAATRTGVIKDAGAGSPRGRDSATGSDQASDEQASNGRLVSGEC